MKKLHEMNFVHNDLKLENILLGHQDTGRFYLIDFGLASPYLDEKGEHIKKQQLYKFSGNFLFASLNSCRGNSKSRRDDIESCIYMLVYLINHNKLPWTDFDKVFSNREDVNLCDYLRERLNKKYTRALFKMVPRDMSACLKTVLCMRFDERPPYELIELALRSCFKRALLTQEPKAPPSHNLNS